MQRSSQTLQQRCVMFCVYTQQKEIEIMKKKEEPTLHYLFNIETGHPFEGFDRDTPIHSPYPPKTGEYLNQSGCYFEVVGILQHFDANYVEVYAKAIGDSREFLLYLQQKVSKTK